MRTRSIGLIPSLPPHTKLTKVQYFLAVVFPAVQTLMQILLAVNNVLILFGQGQLKVYGAWRMFSITKCFPQSNIIHDAVLKHLQVPEPKPKPKCKAAPKPGPKATKPAWVSVDAERNNFKGLEISSADCFPVGVADWHLVFRQSAGTYLTKEEWLHVGDPDSQNFSILKELERFRDNSGKFVFKMVFPNMQAPNFNVWSQTSNPVTATSGGVVGYAPIEIHFDSHHWGGLERSARKTTLLDGSVHEYWWFYAIGTTLPFAGGIPGPSRRVDKVELYVSCRDHEKASVGILTLRQ